MCSSGCINEDYWGDCTVSTRCIYEEYEVEGDEYDEQVI